MTYKEEYTDIFENDKPEHRYAQCISADFGMNAGIAIIFNKKFDCKNKLVNQYGSFEDLYDDNASRLCVETDRVYNLITKRNYWLKPTNASLQNALYELKELCIRDNVKTLVIPPLGCGLDRLNYRFVKTAIISIFSDVDINIICRTNDKQFANRYFN